MDKQQAEKIKLRGEVAIRELVSILDVDHLETQCGEAEFLAVKRGIGLAIGIIDTELLSVVYAQYPELDPIKE